jgi:hypothetical protein
LEQVSVMLRASGQNELVQKLKGYRFSAELSMAGREAVRKNGVALKQTVSFQDDELKRAASDFGKKRGLVFFQSAELCYRFRLEVKRLVSYCLHRLEARFGYFLPYCLSEMRNDEFFYAIRRLTGEEDIKTALVLGAAVGEGSTVAFVKGIQENANRPRVFCVCASKERLVRLRRAFAKDASVRCYGIAFMPGERFAEEMERTVEKIKEENQVDGFDAVLIDNSEIGQGKVLGGLGREVFDAKFIFLDDINSLYNYENCGRLLRDPRYIIVAQNPGLRNGYAIFKMNVLRGFALTREEVGAK